MSKAREGRFVATPVEWGVETSKNGGLPQFVCKFALDAEYGQNDEGQAGYFDVSHEGMEITGWFNLIYKDKQTGQNVVNKINVESLENALGWNRVNGMPALNDSDWSKTQVQLVLESEEYNGKPSVKVRYLNPRDYEGGSSVKKADAQALKQMQQAFGALLAAGAPAAAKKPVSNPVAPQQKPAAAAHEVEKRAAWDAFKAQHAGLDPASLAEAWRKAIADCFDGLTANQLGSEQWKQFRENGFKKPAGESPVSETPQFKEDDIPF
jgi:hypothetical protein